MGTDGEAEGGEEAVRVAQTLSSIAFWVGIALTISEIHRAKKNGAPIARSEKLKMLWGVILVIAVVTVWDARGVSTQFTRPAFALGVAGVFNWWGLKHRILRKARTAAAKLGPASGHPNGLNR